ncbi:ankyrin repeat domain-containing protein 50-like [Ylistrum balloti]|uniref:ankyrin repeat domain-containing protein 50-like n=1 Tax=Ylistrum balloti TaxID=509963 RepID=UPI002905E8B6|nr:ankyrin repeat domain-containing protein 50-like [Ylistrum balloti]XP_060080302.1 ankyrin repeat domain-containing protein 50-like [Ylistrum balloti]XP_060080303.1 ankyrin repeat domain-containing protein 50-like [Ylistrum balloti]
MECVLVETTKRQKKKVITPNTPEQDFYLAIERGDLQEVQTLLERGVDLSYKIEGWSPLTLACECGQEDIVEVIVNQLKNDEENNKGKQRLSDRLNYVSVLETLNDNGDTPLICAARAGHVDVCSLLLESGAYINQTNQHVRQTPLLVAVEHGNMDVVDFLLDCGADVQLTDNINITPLYAAIKARNPLMVQRLIQAGSDVNLGSQDHAPLFLAARLKLLSVVQMLINAGCEKNITIKYGVTPLYEATFRGHTDIVEFLVNEGCDVNKTDMYGVSPLHIASMYGHLNCVILLILGGADMRLRMQHGQTALQVAMEMNHADVVEYFLCRGEDILCKPHGSNSLKIIAAVFEKGHRETVEVLLRGCAKLVLLHYPGVTEMFCNDKYLLEMLFMSGIQTIPGVLTVPKLHPKYVCNPKAAQWLEEYHKKPQSLKSLCRIRLRRCLGNKVLCLSKGLPLPSIIKDYVCLRDISKE